MDEQHLGQRIMIIGCGGAGKSTLARQLGAFLELPVVHLDAEYWHPGWVETPKDDWRQHVEAMTRHDRWIIDGNYTGTLPLRLAAAETIIFLDYAWPICLWRVLRRWRQYRGQTRPDIAPGCPERFNLAFLQWICLDFPRRSRVRIQHLLEQYGTGRQVIIHRSPRATQQWLAGLAAQRNSP